MGAGRDVAFFWDCEVEVYHAGPSEPEALATLGREQQLDSSL